MVELFCFFIAQCLMYNFSGSSSLSLSLIITAQIYQYADVKINDAMDILVSECPSEFRSSKMGKVATNKKGQVRSNRCMSYLFLVLSCRIPTCVLSYISLLEGRSHSSSAIITTSPSPALRLFKKEIDSILHRVISCHIISYLCEV